MRFLFTGRILLFLMGLSPAPALSAPPVVVTSLSTILTEIARETGGDHIHLVALVKPGMDPHEYTPQPEDLIKAGESQLVLASGKKMESSYLQKLSDSIGSRAKIVEVGNLLETPGDDPHWWHSIAHVKAATKIIREEFANLDPADAPDFQERADAYLRKLDALEKWTRSQIALLPRDKRKLVTSHDAFEYFARDYGFTVYPIQGINTQDEPSSRKVAALIETIKEQKVKAVFFESIENPKVLSEVTRETGARAGGQLYADGLGDGEASTYEGMFRHNVTTIVNSLK